MSKKWEYLVKDIGLVMEEDSKVFRHHRASNEEEQSLLCNMGEEGWELVAVKVSPDTTTSYFKRERV